MKLKAKLVLFLFVLLSFFSVCTAEDFWMKMNISSKTTDIHYTCKDELYINTDSATLVSKDKGTSWDTIPTPTSQNILARLKYIDKSGDNLFIAFGGKIYTTQKDSISWRFLYDNDGILDIFMYNNCLFLVDWGGVTKSNEDWTEWTKVLEKSNTSQFNAFAVDSVGTVYVGSINPMAGREGGIYRSYDDGNTWEWYPEIHGIMDMAVDSEGRIFAADFYEVLMSTDNGDSWQSMQNLSAWPSCMVINGIDEIYIGFGETSAVMTSEDHGVSWKNISTGLSGAGVINDMVLSPDGYIYLATDGGVYRSLESTTGINEQENLLPEEAVLYQNYPNPFNNETNISFTIKEISDVRLSVYNIKGEFIKEICDDRLDIGLHEYSFKADNLNSGVYFYKLSINGYVVGAKKMLYLK